MIREFIKVHFIDPFNQDRYTTNKNPPIKEKESILYSKESDKIFKDLS